MVLILAFLASKTMSSIGGDTFSVDRDDILLTGSDLIVYHLINFLLSVMRLGYVITTHSGIWRRHIRGPFSGPFKSTPDFVRVGTYLGQTLSIPLLKLDGDGSKCRWCNLNYVS